MRNLIVSSLVSLDGTHGDPQSWVGDYFDQQAAEESLAVLLDSDAMLMGRNTYDYFAPRWSSPSGPYLERIYEMRKYVFSSTLETADWENTTVLSGDFATEIGKLRDEVDGVILVAGSCQLVRGLIDHDLVDELRLMVFPVLLGYGKRLFGEQDDKKTLKLTDSKTVGGDGVLILTYESA